MTCNVLPYPDMQFALSVRFRRCETIDNRGEDEDRQRREGIEGLEFLEDEVLELSVPNFARGEESLAEKFGVFGFLFGDVVEFGDGGCDVGIGVGEQLGPDFAGFHVFPDGHEFFVGELAFHGARVFGEVDNIAASHAVLFFEGVEMRAGGDR